MLAGEGASISGGGVYALRQHTDGSLYIGGAFTTVDSIGYQGLARLTSGGILDRTFTNPVLNGTVNAVVVAANGTVYAGGTFTTVGIAASTGLAALFSNGTQYTLQTVLPNNTVDALFLRADGSLLVGGQFTAFGNFGRQRLAKLDFTTADTINAPYAAPTLLPRYTVVTMEKRAAGSWVITESNAS